METSAWNWMPFGVREVLELPEGERRHISIPAMSVSGSHRAILQDLGVFVNLYNIDLSTPGVPAVTPTVAPGGDGTTTPYLFMRIGYDGRGYFTDDLHPIGLFPNAGRPEVGVWRFIRPYRIHPGERLKVTGLQFNNLGDADYWDWESAAGVNFFGRRLKDNRPINLHDGSDTIYTDGQPYNLMGQGLWCPSDSSVEIHGVAYHGFSDRNNMVRVPASIQVWGPDDREWFKVGKSVTGTAFFKTATELGFIDPPGNLIKLGEERGWFRKTDETILVELENPYAVDRGDNDMSISVTLRGSMEVQHG